MTSNGRFPLSRFVHRGGNIYLSPSLNARWDEMVRLGVEKYGVRLYITGNIDGLGGWNGYRPWDAQVAYKRHYGNMAAEVGKSSHGGVYRFMEVFALDIANVDALAPGNPSLARARLTALAKAVGLTVNFVTPTEWWHVGDFNPPWTAPSFGAVTVNPHTTNRPVPKEDIMEAYVAVPSGSVVHLFNGGRHIFGSKQEYEAYRGDVNFIRERGGLDMADVPDLFKVVNVSWATFERLRDNFGVPDDNAFQGQTIDIEKLAKDLAARMGYDVAAVRAAVRAELSSLTLKAA